MLKLPTAFVIVNLNLEALCAIDPAHGLCFPCIDIFSFYARSYGDHWLHIWCVRHSKESSYEGDKHSQLEWLRNFYQRERWGDLARKTGCTNNFAGDRGTHGENLGAV